MRPASRSARPARATRSARAAAAASRKSSTGPRCRRPRSAHLASHHQREHGLALQPLRRARRRRRAQRYGKRRAVPAPRRRMTRPRLLESARRLLPLAWPVFVGQIAVLAFSTVDTVLVARASALDLAALAIGARDLHLDLRRPDGRGARDRTDRRPAVRRRQAARERPRGRSRRSGWRSGCRCSAARVLLFPDPFLAPRAGRAGGRRARCAATCAAWPSRCRRRWCSWPIAASTSRSRGRRR